MAAHRTYGPARTGQTEKLTVLMLVPKLPRKRFAVHAAASFQEIGVPGGDLVDVGLADLAAGKTTLESLLLSLAAPRLQREGVPMGSVQSHPEQRLYDLLSESEGDLAHARYVAYLRQVVSFADSLRVYRLPRGPHAS